MKNKIKKNNESLIKEEHRDDSVVNGLNNIEYEIYKENDDEDIALKWKYEIERLENERKSSLSTSFNVEDINLNQNNHENSVVSNKKNISKRILSSAELEEYFTWTPRLEQDSSAE